MLDNSRADQLNTVINVEGLWKQYRLGSINHGTLISDIQSWWARLRGKDDPNLRIDQIQKLQNPTPSAMLDTETDRCFWALRDVSFSVKEGTILGIIGRNGAGKSTLLKIMSRLTRPTLGQVRIRGRVSSLLEVGTGFHPELTGRENVYLNGAIHGMGKQEVTRKLDEIVAFAEIDKFIDTPVKRYSSGMYVRLAFAVAAHLDPEILIVDEVLAVGDIVFQKKCLGRMEAVRKAGRTVLFVSHQLNMVESICDEAIIIDKGCLVKRGTTSDIITEYMKSSCDNRLYKDNLLNIKNRRGNGKILLKSFHIEDTSGNKWDNIISGMDVVFVFGYECQFEENLDNVDIGMSFHSIIDNQALTILYASYVGKVFKIVNKNGFFRCMVKRFPFVEGKYKLRARLTVNGAEADFPLDGIVDIDVVCGDFFRSGSPGFGPGPYYLVDGEWAVE